MDTKGETFRHSLGVLNICLTPWNLGCVRKIPMLIQNSLDKIHGYITSNRWLQLFTVFTRCLLAVAFVQPSITKILHKPFTTLPDSNPVGAYFNALYNTGFYYEFIGWSQLTAAVLLLFPRTAHIGALMFLPIIANIAVLTTSVGFVGTCTATCVESTAIRSSLKTCGKV